MKPARGDTPSACGPEGTGHVSGEAGSKGSEPLAGRRCCFQRRGAGLAEKKTAALVWTPTTRGILRAPCRGDGTLQRSEARMLRGQAPCPESRDSRSWKGPPFWNTHVLSYPQRCPPTAFMWHWLDTAGVACKRGYSGPIPGESTTPSAGPPCPAPTRSPFISSPAWPRFSAAN